MQRPWTSTAVVLVLVGASAGCGGGSPKATPAPSTTSLSPTASPTPSPTAAFDQSSPVAAYRAYYAAVIKAARTANWRSPDLPATATGKALASIAENLRRLETKGQTLRGTVKINPTPGPVNATSATVYDCQDSSGWLTYDRSGRPVATGSPRNDRVVATVVRESGIWKVSDFTSFDKGGC
jgi:hypothetical protein